MKSRRALVLDNKQQRITHEQRQNKGDNYSKKFIVSDFKLQARQSKDGELLIKMTGLEFDDTYETPYFKERVAPTAFNDTIRDVANGEHTTFILNSHDTGDLLASTDIRKGEGSVILYTNDKGLYADISLAQTQLGRDIYRLTNLGVLNGASIGFISEEERVLTPPDDSSDPRMTYIQEKVKLIEISFTSFPAYESSDVEIAENINKKERDEHTGDEEVEQEDEVVEDIEPIIDDGLEDAPSDKSLEDWGISVDDIITDDLKDKILQNVKDTIVSELSPEQTDEEETDVSEEVTDYLLTNLQDL